MHDHCLGNKSLLSLQEPFWLKVWKHLDDHCTHKNNELQWKITGIDKLPSKNIGGGGRMDRMTSDRRERELVPHYYNIIKLQIRDIQLI